MAMGLLQIVVAMMVLVFTWEATNGPGEGREVAKARGEGTTTTAEVLCIDDVEMADCTVLAGGEARETEEDSKGKGKANGRQEYEKEIGKREKGLRATVLGNNGKRVISAVTIEAAREPQEEQIRPFWRRYIDSYSAILTDRFGVLFLVSMLTFGITHNALFTVFGRWGERVLELSPAKAAMLSMPIGLSESAACVACSLTALYYERHRTK